MKNKKKLIAVSLLFWGLVILFEVGELVTLFTGLEYRSLVFAGGKCLIAIGIPLWLLLLIFCRMKSRGWKIWKTLVMVVCLMLIFVWSSFYLLWLALFQITSEHTLVGKYLIVDTNHEFLNGASWHTYEKTAFFFRRESDGGEEMERLYLEKKYKENFIKTQFAGKMKDYCRDEQWQDKDWAWGSESHPEVPVFVRLNGDRLQDNYSEALADWYVYRMMQEKACRTDCVYDDAVERWCFRAEEGGIGEFTEDMAEILPRIAQDDFFRKNRGTLYFYSEIEGRRYYGQLPFGKLSEWDKLETGYYSDGETLLAVITEKYEQLKKQAADDAEWERKVERQREELRREESREEQEYSQEKESGEDAPGGGYATGEGDMADGGYVLDGSVTTDEAYAEAGRRIYETFLQPEAKATQFKICYNAKGYPYYDLGEDGTFAYTLLYDRDSKNGACMLYVLYQAPYDEAKQNYASYTDSACQIADIYAVVKETGEIIPSGRRHWEDVGSAEYREATGE